MKTRRQVKSGKVVPLRPRKQELVVVPPTGNTLVDTILRVASTPNLNLAAVDKLMEMRREMSQEAALQAFNEALTRAQAAMRPVAADKRNEQTKSVYASYAALDRMLRPIYVDHGFSISFNTEDSPLPEHVRVIAYVSNSNHTRTYRVDIPADGKGAKGGDVMTKTHAAGSAMTYGQRYLLKFIFNIAVGPDDDGRGAGGDLKFVTDDQAEELQQLLLQVGAFEKDFLQKFLDFCKVESVTEIPAEDFVTRRDGLRRRLQTHKDQRAKR